MNIWLTLSPTLQAVMLFVFGAFVGGQVNRGIYRLAWDARRIGPWSPPEEGAPPRTVWDRLPVLGWLLLRRESSVHGTGFWVRPMLIELGLGLGLAGLHHWELHQGLLPKLPPALTVDPELLLAQFCGHALLIALMTVATFIDFDEKTIPDAITVPGTLAGLAIAAAMPLAGLPVLAKLQPLVVSVEALRLSTPHAWPADLDGVKGLAIGCFCFAGWCAALVPRLWTLRRGWRKAVQLCIASMLRSGRAGWLGLLAVVGCVVIAGVWQAGGEYWHSLLSSLVGLAFGGGLVWSVRIVASSVLGEEAMGFGDVTLMAMIGAFLGWQSSLLVFFLAPFGALFIALGQWALTGRRDIAFGPYLCFAAVVLIVLWREIWHRRTAGMFGLGADIPLMVFACILVLGPLLWLVRFVKLRMLGDDQDEELADD